MPHKTRVNPKVNPPSKGMSGPTPWDIVHVIADVNCPQARRKIAYENELGLEA